MAKYFNKDVTALVIDAEEIEVIKGVCDLTEEQFEKVKGLGFAPFIEPSNEIQKEEKHKRTPKAKQ